MKATWETWGEFKRAVEALGVTDDARIIYIDASPLGAVQAEYEPENGALRGGWKIE